MPKINITNLMETNETAIQVVYDHSDLNQMLNPDAIKPMIVNHVARAIAEDILSKIEIKINDGGDK